MSVNELKYPAAHVMHHCDVAFAQTRLETNDHPVVVVPTSQPTGFAIVEET